MSTARARAHTRHKVKRHPTNPIHAVHSVNELIGVKASKILKWGPCALAFLIYVASLRFGFIHDDHAQIVSNPQVHSWGYLPRLLTTDMWSQRAVEHVGYYYRPLFSLWLLILHTIGDLSPWFWHLSSVALHTIATYFVFIFCLELLENVLAASYAALLFAVHPIHIESVCWISAGNEILYTILALLSLLLFVRGLRVIRHEKSAIWPSIVLWSAALLTKETTIALLPLFFFLAYKFDHNSLDWRARMRQAIHRGIPFSLAAALYFVARLIMLGRAGLERGEHTWQQIVLNSPSIVAFYFRKLLWPVRLSGFYMNPLISASTGRMWVTLVLIFGGVGVLAWSAMRRSAVSGLAAGLFVIPILPVLFAMRIFHQGNLTHDRYLYLPSVGLCLLMGLLARHLWAGSDVKKVVAGTTGALLLAPFIWLNLTQQWFYKDDEAFYRRGIEVNPDNVYVIDALGSFYLAHKQFDPAIEQFSRAHKLAPHDRDATFFLAKGFFANGQYDAAEPYFEQLSHDTRLGPKLRAVVLLSLGQAEIRLGHLPHAEEVLRELNNENGSYPGLHDTLGVLFQMEGKIPEAQSEYAREFQVSGNLRSQQKALGLTQLMRSSAKGSFSTEPGSANPPAALRTPSLEPQ